MAGNYQFALAWQSYAATASAAATDHPATNVALVKQPRKTWKDSGTGTGANIVCDQGAAVTLGAVFLNGGTVATWTVEESATGSGGWSTLAASPITVPADARVNRRKAWVSIASTLQYLRFTVASLASGSTVAELGALALIPTASLVTLTRNLGRPTYKVTAPEEVIPFDGGSFDVNEEGDLYLEEYELAQPTLVLAGGTLDQLHAIHNARDVILFENFDHPEHAYLGRVLSMDAVPRTAFVTSVNMQFREYA